MSNNRSGVADFDKLTDDVLYGSLALSPVSATQTGYHEHNGGARDEMLDDYSATGIEAQRKLYEGFQVSVNALSAASLDKEQQADLEIIKHIMNLSRLDMSAFQCFIYKS